MRKKLLVVEDEKIDALNIGRVLKERFPNIALEVVNNGEQVLDWIQRFRPDTDGSVFLVLMDLTIPRMSGLDLVSEFKGNSHLRNAPIVILSGSDSPQAMKTAYDSGASAYLVKPATTAEMRNLLIATLDFWLNANRLPQA